MKKSILATFVVTLMVVTSMAVLIDSSNLNSNSGIVSTPQTSHISTEIGNVYIYANGTVSNTTAISRTGSEYTLQSNINGTLFDNRNNSILQGNGLLINGGGNYALYTSYTRNITMEHLNLTSSYETAYIAYSINVGLNSSSVTTTSTDNAAVFLEYSNYVWIETDNISAAQLSNSDNGAIFTANDMVGLDVSNSTIKAPTAFFSGYSIANSVWTNNTVNDTYLSISRGSLYFGGYVGLNLTVSHNVFNISPLYATTSQRTLSFDLDTAQNIVVIGNLFNGSNKGNNIYAAADYYENITIIGNTFISTASPIQINYAANVLVSYNTFVNVSDYAVEAYYSSNVVLVHNKVINYTGTGDVFDLEYLSNTSVSDNSLKGTANSSSNAIYTYENINTWIYSNTAYGFYYGIYLQDSTSTFVYNNVVLNTTSGITVYSDVNVGLNGNNVTNSTSPLYVTSSQNLNIYANTYSAPINTTGHMLEITDSNNIMFYHNNMIGPSNLTSFSADSAMAFNESLPVGGNYWSQYNGTGSGGIGTTQYNLSGSYADYLPLTSKWTGYTVTFLEKGLAQGTSWGVAFDNKAATTTSGSLVYSPDAAQRISVGYTVQNVTGYTVSSNTGTVALDGANKVVTIVFNEVPAKSTPAEYDLVVNETGLPAGLQWNITVSGNTFSTTGTSISVQVQNGTYNVTVGAPSGYATSSGNINATMNGHAVTYNVVFSAAVTSNNGTGNNTSPSNIPDIGIGIGIGVIVGGLAASIGTMFYTGTGFFRKP